jgi:hypothetical protein
MSLSFALLKNSLSSAGSGEKTGSPGGTGEEKKNKNKNNSNNNSSNNNSNNNNNNNNNKKKNRNKNKKERAMKSAPNALEQLHRRMAFRSGTDRDRWRYVIHRSEGLCP